MHIVSDTHNFNVMDLAINEFADEDPDEFHLTHHGLKPELRLDDSTRSVPHERYVRATPPDSFDWRSSNKVSAVRNQGTFGLLVRRKISMIHFLLFNLTGKCGSCWAFTSVSHINIPPYASLCTWEHFINYLCSSLRLKAKC